VSSITQTQEKELEIFHHSSKQELILHNFFVY